MASNYDLIIRGGTVVAPGTIGCPTPCDLGIRNGRFASIGDLTGATAVEEVSATGLHVLPGVIDSQCHFREPGLEHKEDLESGTRGAVLGGVTAIFEMPNTKPSTTTDAALKDKLRRAQGRTWCDHAFYVGASAENAGDLGRLEALPGAAGVKIFMGSSTGDLLVADDATLDRVLAHGRRRVAVHSEDEDRLRERRALIPPGAGASWHPQWRDVETALRSTTRLLRMARVHQRRIHVLHVTTAEELALLAGHRDLATVEVLPQHLVLSAPECYERFGSLVQMNPPIRDERHRQALWAAVAQGLVDVLGSDHAPHSLEEKALPYPQSPSGLPGVQTLLPLMLNQVATGRLTLERLVDLTSAGAHRIFGLAAKGRIALGFDADLTLVDLAAKRTITNASIASRCGWTPYDGMTVTGWPVMTMVRGNMVMRDGGLLGSPLGGPVRFLEAAWAPATPAAGSGPG